MSNVDTQYAKKVGKGLKDAREAAGLTRARLGSMTNISPRALEKIEAGTQEASASRLKALCAALEIDPAQFLREEGENTPVGPRDPASPIIQDMEPQDRSEMILAEIDTIRTNGFVGSSRRVMALASMAKVSLSYVEPEDLEKLANDRGIASNDLHQGATVSELFETDPCKGHVYCSDLEDRIIDTAVLGMDLHSLGDEEVEALAEELSDVKAISRPGFFDDWEEPKILLELIRPLARQVVSSGIPLSILNDSRIE